MKILTLAQISRTWWAGSRHAVANASQRLRQLEAAGLIERRTLSAHPELTLAAPVFSWEPESFEPDFGAVAYALQSRWTKPPVPTPIVLATSKGRRRFGGYFGGRAPRSGEATHDIHLAQVFLWHRTRSPELATRWISDRQQSVERRGQAGSYPDVLVRNGPATELVIEFGGSYRKAKLEAFHRGICQFPYQIW